MEDKHEDLQENIEEISTNSDETLTENLQPENDQSEIKKTKEPCRLVDFPENDRLGNLLLNIVESLILEHDQLQLTKCKPEQLPEEMLDIQTYRVGVSEEDMGRVIGKNGKTARSIRSVMRSAAIKNGMKVDVRIGPHYDPESSVEGYDAVNNNTIVNNMSNFGQKNSFDYNRN